MDRNRFVEVLKTISEMGGDNEGMMDLLKELQDDYDARGESYGKQAVFDDDGKPWKEKYFESRQRYRDRFFSSGEEAKQAQTEDVQKDSDSGDVSFEDLFSDREGDYKH